jgi:diaminopimelate decarboxylase
MQQALEVGIHCFNVESEQELETLNEVAADMNKTATISFRVNPDVDAKTHPYISTGLKENKFGISFDDAERIYLKASKMGNIVIKGIDFHIGSQLTELSPFVDAVDRLLALIKNLSDNGIKIEHMDLGGGIGVQYNDESPPLPAEWVTALKQRFDNFDGEIIVEPGRAIAGNAGILLTRVTVDKKTKHKNFAIIDAGMNDLMRPALYDAWQNIIPVKEESNVEPAVYDVVGPICETGDFLGKDRKLSIQPGDLLAIRTSGAYGFTMSSNYNSRGRAAEVMVDGDQHYLVRERETFEDLIHGESLLPE